MKIQRRNKATPEFSLAAMVDVILLLLIFFMVTSAASNISQIEVQLPKTDTENTSANDQTTVTIQPNGRFYVDDEEIEKTMLEQKLVQKLQTKSSPAFIIRADENTFHKDVVFVMEIAEKHKYNIALATTKADK